MESLLLDALVYLSIAVIIVPIAKKFGLGLVLGYLLSGFLAGPILGLISSDTGSLMSFVELGVIMMLFLIGLELQPRALWEMRSKLLGLGGLQVILTVAAVALAGKFIMGASWNYAIACGLILSLSSTAIVLQTLEEKGLLKSHGGQSSFAVLLFQDIAVIPMLALLPLLASPELAELQVGDDVAHHLDFNLVHGLPGWQVALINICAIAAVVVGGHYLSRPFFRYIAAARLREIFTATALLLVLSITVLMSLVGLSPALGAFLAGVVLANSEFRRELESNIEPFKGILLGLFFITVGGSINLEIISDNAFLVISSTLGLIVLKALILFIIASVFGIQAHSDRWLFTLSLAQAGEFGFVLLAFAMQNSVLPSEISNNLLAVVALSMLITPLIFLFYEKIVQPYLDSRKGAKDDDYDKSSIQKGTVIIAGHGRFGQVVDRILLANGYKTVVLEYKADVIDRLRTFGVETFYGDAVRPDLLHAAGLADAKIFVVAIDDLDKAVELVTNVRAERPDIHIIARAWDRRQVYRLFQAGANDIVREVFDSSVRAGSYALEALGMSQKQSLRKAEIFFQHDREAVRKLAQVWDPNIQLHENKKFVALSRELRDDIEMAMQSDSNLQKDITGKAKSAAKTSTKKLPRRKKASQNAKVSHPTAKAKN